jgi:AcrR family transcriptional regulator
LFGTHGYAGVTTTDIVATAGVTRGALYHHFADKRALFLAAVDTVDERLARSMTNAAADLATPDARLRRTLDTYVDGMSSPEMTRLGIESRLHGADDNWRHVTGVITHALAAFDGGNSPLAVGLFAAILIAASREGAAVVAHLPAARGEDVRRALHLFVGCLVPR